jgi:hypothetical protein
LEFLKASPLATEFACENTFRANFGRDTDLASEIRHANADFERAIA